MMSSQHSVPDASIPLECSHKDCSLLLSDILRQSKAVYLTVRGVSMYPSLRDKDVVKIVPPTHKVRRGKVILCKDKQEVLILHRVVQVCSQPERYLVRGDNSWSEPQEVKHEQIIGIVSAVRRGSREIPIGWVSMLRYGYLLVRIWRRLAVSFSCRIRRLIGEHRKTV